MYKELEKYKIRENVDGVGDLLSDFIDHKNMLNKVKIIHQL